jgi:hypothetical protein
LNVEGRFNDLTLKQAEACHAAKGTGWRMICQQNES